MHAARSGDPNFPQGLRIQPSSSQRGPRTCQRTGEVDCNAPHTADRTQTASWEEDTPEDIESFGIAGRIWEAAYLLARYLRPSDPLLDEIEFDPPCSLFRRTDSAPLTIVELGSGAGYGSLHLARQLLQQTQGAQQKPPKTRLVLTDLENVVPLMDRNVARAGYQHPTELLDVRVRSLAWGNESQAAKLVSELATAQADGSGKVGTNPLSHILCSDLVYFPELLPPLLRSIIWLSGHGLQQTDSGSSSSIGPELIISYKIRSLTKEQPFWSALDSWFDFRAVDCRSVRHPSQSKNTAEAVESISDWHRFGSEGEDYGALAASDQELFVFVGHRRKDTIGCWAPESDSDLMQGKRCRPRQELQAGAGFELEPSSGENYFEWLLLSNMGAGLV